MTQAAGAQNTERRWIYNQGTGQLRNPDGQIIAEEGYSGAPGWINNPDAEGQVNEGPIPRGTWRIGPQAVDNPTTGRFSIPLEPDGHDARGRTGFFIHGFHRDRPRASSLGCPIFTFPNRQAIMNSGVNRFDVVNEPRWQQ